MALFSPFGNDFFEPFQPLFQLLDDDTFRPVYPVRGNGARNGKSNNARGGITSFMPRFDVRESKDAYHLDGELPGLKQDDIELTFSDAHTLLLKGKLERSYTETNVDEKNEAAAKQPTVEDAKEEDGKQVTKQNNETAVTQGADDPAFKYWVSERSSGSFHRTFNFPAKVDQDNVRASLKDGILSVVVPKATATPTKKIQIN